MGETGISIQNKMRGARVLGVCTRYCHHEAPQIAMRIADWELDRGGDATLFSTTKCAPALNAIWDRDVASTNGMRFTEWAEKCSTVVWTHVPHKEQITWCNKKGINTVLYVIWHELDDTDRAAVREAKWVVSPSAGCARSMATEWSAQKSLAAPFDPGLPLTRKDERLRSNYIWVLLPLFDREPFKMENTAIEVAGRLLDAREDIVLTAVYNSSTMNSRAKKRLNEFKRFFGLRMRVIRSLPLDYRPLVFQGHDVTMWPAHYDSVGITPLTSMYMGTPVVSFKFSPASEYMTKENSVPVACGEHYNRIGAPLVDPDYQCYERCLQNVVINRDYLTSLQQSVLHGLEKRRKVFDNVMARVIC